MKRTVVSTEELVTQLPRTKYKTVSTYDHKAVRKETAAAELPHATVPDQAMSIKEILRRYASGLPLDGERVPFYEFDEGQPTDESMPDFSRMDKVDIEMYAKELKVEKDRLKQILDVEVKAAKAKADALAKIQRTSGEKGDQGEDDQPGNNPGPKAKLPAEGDRSKSNSKQQTPPNNV